MKYLLIIYVIFFAGCKKDFLESKDTGSLNRQTYVNSLSTMEKYVNGIQLLLLRDYHRSPSAAYGDLIADDIKVNLDYGSTLLAQYSWSQKANSDFSLSVADESLGMNGEWRNSYIHIRSCNFVIEDVDKYRSENPEKADNLKGQAYAFRALLHFKLANIFSQTYSFSENASHINVPYITTSDITVPYKRNTTFEVYNNLIEDLQSAIKLLKPVSNTKEMNQDAAKALLARIYLFKGDYNNAKKLALEITSTHPLMTIAQGYPDKIYYFLTPAQTESLYQLQPAYVSDPVFILNNFVGSVYRGYSVTYFPSQDIVNIIQENPGDIRNQWLTKTGANWVVSKYPIGIAGINTFTPTADYYHTIFRSSEMFLTVAEAAYHTNDENTAREYLNAIRKRSDPAISDIIATGPDLLDSICKERRKEFAFEGNRMFDLQRWHKSVQRSDPSVPTATSLNYPSNKAIAPIPIQDVNLAGIEQNKDY